MFRKIVSNLSFSPALVGQLGFYAKRLRKEEATRRLGLIFTSLALVIQFFAVFQPPEAANAASSADWVPGGVSSVQDFLHYYDRNSKNIKSILSSLGVTRQEIKSAKYTVIGESSRYNWSMTSLYSYAQGQRSYTYKKAGGGTGTVYYRPMRLTQEGGDRHAVFAGFSKSIGWFAIKKDCGNLITAKKPPVLHPAAQCKNLNVDKITSTRFRFHAKASQRDGAKIKSYTYVVKNSSGKVVEEKTVKSSASTNSYTYKQSKPDKYSVKLIVATSLGKRTDQDCRASFTVAPPKPQPAAYCKSIDVDLADRTIVSLAGSASVAHGAHVKKYVFVVKDSKGKKVKQLTVSSSKLSATVNSFTLTTPGKYTVSLTIQTSVGNKTDQNDCVKQFTIAKPAVCSYNPSLPPSSPDCQPCPGDSTIWIKDESCHAEVISSKTATNMTQGNINAALAIARPGDKISYTLTVTNKGTAPQKTTFRESLEDVLEYSTLLDNGGGTFDPTTKTLAWPEVDLAPGAAQSRTIVVQTSNPIPATNTGTSNEASYDCTMTNTFGNSIDIHVKCPVEKVAVESTVSELPHTGPKENLIFAGVFLAVVVYFYSRSRQLGREIRLVRRDVTAGAI